MTPADARRRWFGSLFLILAGGLLIWGQTLLQPVLKGWAFVVYWLLCFVFTGLAMLVALLDFYAIRRRTREEHRDLIKTTFLKGREDTSERRPEDGGTDDRKEP